MTEVCLICSEELTIKNIVNPECGHATCKDCFWKWTKQKNSCAFCRKSLLCDDDELQDIQHMRGLLEHRTRIIREVEEAYQENDELNRKKREIKHAIIVLDNKLNLKKQEGDDIVKNIRKLRSSRNEISQSLGGTYGAFQHFKKRVEAREIINRNVRKRIDMISRFIPSRYQAMCMEVLRDIKILGMCCSFHESWSCPCRECCRNTHIEKVYEINNKRKKRKKFRKERLREGLNFDLESLFRVEPIEQSPWNTPLERDEITENIFRGFMRNNQINPIPLEEDIIHDFTSEESRFILDRIINQLYS